MNARLFAGRGFTLLQAQRWAGSLATLFAFAACAVSGELGPALLLALHQMHLVRPQAVRRRSIRRAFYRAHTAKPIRGRAHAVTIVIKQWMFGGEPSFSFVKLGNTRRGIQI